MLTESQRADLASIITLAASCLRDEEVYLDTAHFFQHTGAKLALSIRPKREPAFSAELMRAQEVVA